MLFKRFIEKDRDFKKCVILVNDQTNKTYVKLASGAYKGGWKFIPLKKIEKILESLVIDFKFIKRINTSRNLD